MNAMSRGFVTTQDKWFMTPVPRPEARVQLICFHHAGGGAFSFRSWPEWLAPKIELTAVQLPGRENRYGEAPLTTPEAAVSAITARLAGILRGPFALFGYSMGAALAYLAACRLLEQGREMPRAMLVGGAPAPTGEVFEASPWRTKADLNEKDLVAHLRRIGGIPAPILANQELLGAFLPTLMADFKIVVGVRDEKRPRLPVPITAIYGADDPLVDEAGARAWADLTDASVAVQAVSGDHFIVTQAVPKLAEIINETICGGPL